MYWKLNKKLIILRLPKNENYMLSLYLASLVNLEGFENVSVCFVLRNVGINKRDNCFKKEADTDS